jgi:hypothetical protein
MRFQQRLIINTKDVENLTGLCQRSARRLLRKIRRYLEKDDDDYITIPEFCEYTGMPEEHVREFLSG